MNSIESLRAQIKGLEPTAAIAVIDEYLKANPDSDEALTLRGLRHWSAGDRAEAINDYLAAIHLNPESPAREALRAANEILDYRNKDLYNP